MGIDLSTFAGLAELSSRFTTARPSLMVGRQEFGRPKGVRHGVFQRALSRWRPGEDLAAMYQPDGYAETMFARLGFPGIEVMDASDYEFDRARGGIVHDLNLPVPDALHGRYGFIFDGRTLEHIFNLPMAFENLFRMLAPGGRVFATNPLNGWPEHGMYQFSAELIYAFWRRMAGCTVLACRAVAWRSGGYRRDLPDPAEVGGRLSLWSWRSPLRNVPGGRLLLQYEVEKPASAVLRGSAQQSDYAAIWAASGRAEAGGASHA